ncbi:DUF2333 family protein [Magnetospirillum gryphiswaldense]|uniref:Protein conserved in bacteria n=1 Tax=Magnetospirillum gryphiswaldense TaxID=55518 RepID=A4U2Z9_9PROT|nr:DUF2333 family protein [Magnetospirillum gryphiswaldense]AVM75400.1 hypothetical protein MSR1_29330 [Magnetospirillum gryphiswaldense MSR-1]AVM79303.1 hypothetical protein MSR1L_29330 [Magnetospirillum gryphiswaldense]CAM77256.1 protein conserved in bacteria [Magnetospirillum gryphiswaldense MSR-1]
MAPQTKRWLAWLLPVLPVLLLLYYGIGMGLAHKIDADPEYGPGTVAAPQSRAVAMAARLILREVDDHKWVANDPFFNPSSLLDNMPAYQTGIVGAIARVTAHLNGLSIESGAEDLELSRAAGFLKYPGTVWKFDSRTSWAPTASSEKQYRSAARNLLVFNDHLTTGDAVFARDRATLAKLLALIGTDMDAAADRLDAHLAQGHWTLFDAGADDLYFDTKGRLYAQSMILRELGWDFAQILAAADLGEQWQAMLAALNRAAALQPALVLAGDEDSALLPNHLTNQGFRLLQARSRLAGLAAALAGGDEH